MSREVVSSRSAKKIDERVAKLLRDIDAVEPPLDLDAVRDFLELSRGYYSKTNTGLLSDVLHKLQVGSQQVIRDPTRIIDVVKQRKLRALWVPQKRKILLDESLHKFQLRWGEGHEILHSMLPHHQVLNLGDPEHTLSQSCLDRIEAQANYGAGKLLYLGDAYRERLFSSQLTLDWVFELADGFGNSKKSGLWRAVETTEEIACGVCSVHPWDREAADDQKVSHFIRSDGFIEQFGNLTDLQVYAKLARVVYRHGNGPIGEKQVELLDDAGEVHLFHFKCWANDYGVMSLGTHAKRKPTAVAV